MPGQDESPAARPSWWHEDEGSEAVVQTLSGLVTVLRAGDSVRRARYRLWDLMYDGDSLVDGQNVGIADVVRGMTGETTFNYAARALDMVHSRVSAELPTVRATGHGADYEQHLRAQDLSRFIVGMSEALELTTELPRAVHCALRVGTGAVFADASDDEPTVEVFHPRELLVDPDDALHGDPRALYRVSPQDRNAVIARFPDRVDDVVAAGCASYRDATQVGRPGDWTIGSSTGRVSDCVDLIDAWLLPMGDSPGRHVRCLDHGAPLVDEPWDCPRFPVAVLRAWEPTVSTGFYGRGVMERLASSQVEVDELWRHVCRQMKFSNTIGLLPDGSDITEAALTDTDPDGITVYRYSNGPGGGAPSFVNPPVLGPETMPVLQALKADIYAMAGTDESAVSSQTRLGPNASGVALRTMHDFESQGHVDLMKRIGRFCVDVVDRVIDAARRRYGSSADAEADWVVRHPTMDAVRWSEVGMDRDAYVLELEESSPVPDTLAGRLQDLEEDAAAGRVPPEYMVRLREDPDRWWAERVNSKEDVDFVDWIVSECLDPRRPVPDLPTDECPLPMLIDRVRREVLASVRLGRPPGVLARLRDMGAQAAEAIQQAQQPQAPVAPPGGPGVEPTPTGAPPPPPVNP
jgi:hypothetical protein